MWWHEGKQPCRVGGVVATGPLPMLPAGTRVASPSAATLFPGRATANRPDGPSFKAACGSLSSWTPVDAATQAVLFDAVPLLVAVLALAVGLAIGYLVRRERAGEPGGQHDREAMSAGLSQQLLDASEPADVAKVLLDELAQAFALDLANLALIDDDGLVGRDRLRPRGREGSHRPRRQADRARPRAVGDQRRRPRGNGVRGLRRRALPRRQPAAERDRQGEELRLRAGSRPRRVRRRRLRRRSPPARLRRRRARPDAGVRQ